MTTPIAPESLKALLAGTSPPVLLHLLPETDFEEAHLPGAQNFCVYESAFVSKIAEAFPDKRRPLVVYGHSDTTQEAGAALAKLRIAGYTNVAALKGDIDAWRAA